MNPYEVRWNRLASYIETMTQAAQGVAALVGEDETRHSRIVTLSDVKAAMCHIVAEEGKHG